jgi:hypothetical protein
LRNITDAETVLTKGATIPKTLASLLKITPEPKAPSKATTKKWIPRKTTLTVEVIKGQKVTKKKFKL